MLVCIRNGEGTTNVMMKTTMQNVDGMEVTVVTKMEKDMNYHIVKVMKYCVMEQEIHCLIIVMITVYLQ